MRRRDQRSSRSKGRAAPLDFGRGRWPPVTRTGRVVFAVEDVADALAELASMGAIALVAVEGVDELIASDVEGSAVVAVSLGSATSVRTNVCSSGSTATG